MKTTDIDDFKNLIFELKVKPGDKILLHASFISLGRLDFAISEAIDVLLKILGPEGNLVVPAFTYSFRKGQAFDPQQTMVSSELGILPEIFRSSYSRYRSWDGLFSFASLNEFGSAFMRVDAFCFGPGSFFDFMCRDNYKLLSVGVEFSRGLTAFVHAECLADVPYRKFQKFKGTLLKNGDEFLASSTHFTWETEWREKYVTNRQPYGKFLKNSGLLNGMNFRYGYHFTVPLADFVGEVSETLIKTPLLMLEKKNG